PRLPLCPEMAFSGTSGVLWPAAGTEISPKKGTNVSTAVTGTRGVYLADKEEKLPYRVVDADNHFYPTADAIDRHLDPKMRERALLPGETFVLENEEDINEEKHVDAHTWKTTGEHPVPEGGHGGVDMSEVPAMDANIPIPGAMLNRLNPMRDLDNLSRVELVQRYNEMRPAFEHN